MPKLTRIRLAQILDILDESFFTSAGFEVETSEDSNKIVTVQFRDKGEYFIELRYDTKRINNPFSNAAFRSLAGVSDEQTTRILRVQQAPGDFVEVESHEVKSFAEFLESIRLWTERIKNECLLVSLFQRKLQKLQDELNKKIDEHIKDGNEHFSEDERANLYEKLNQFQERIVELENDNTITKLELEEIKKVLADLAKATYTMSKRSWFRTFFNKLSALSIRALSSQPGQRLIEGTIDKLLQ